MSDVLLNDKEPLFSVLCYLPMDLPGLYSGITDDRVYALAGYGGEDLPLCQIDRFWTFVPERNLASIELWIESLSFLYPLLDEYTKTPSAEICVTFSSVLNSFLTFSKNRGELFIKKSDHSICSRIIVLIRALTYFSSDWPLRNDVQNFVIEQADILSSGELPHIGNHGIMQDIALLNAACIIETDKRAGWVDVALSRAYDQMLIAFDEDGVNNENSSWYALFNYRLFNEIVALCTHYAVEHQILKEMARKLQTIEDALCWMVLPNKWITLIGDH